MFLVYICIHRVHKYTNSCCEFIVRTQFWYIFNKSYAYIISEPFFFPFKTYIHSSIMNNVVYYSRIQSISYKFSMKKNSFFDFLKKILLSKVRDWIFVIVRTLNYFIVGQLLLFMIEFQWRNNRKFWIIRLTRTGQSLSSIQTTNFKI